MSQSRFAAVSRRALLQGMSATALLGLAACTTTDAQLLAPTTTPTAAGSTSGQPSADPTAAGAGQLVIDFTYTVDTAATSSERGGGRGGGGMVRNPYIAVWVEDQSGNLVRTISLWHLQNGQDRWLSELHRWYSAAQGVDTTSSATRAAGSYAVAWDRSDSAGDAVPDGAYVLCLEATREHGPYSLITAELGLTGEAIEQALTPNGELTAARVAYTPA